MAHPLILYALQDLENPSFETDADATDPPTGWDDTASVNGQNEVDTAQYHSAGEGIPSAKSVLQNVDDATGGNKAILRQRFAVTNLPAYMKAEGRVEIAAAAMRRPANQTALDNARLVIRQYSGGTITPGSGAEETPPSSREFICGKGDDWDLAIYAATLHADTDYLDICLEYALGTYDAAADIHWDRVFLGALLDLSKGFKSFRMALDPGYQANEGDGTLELIKTASASTLLTLQIVNLLEGSDLYWSWVDFNRWLCSDVVGSLAIWGNRDLHTNFERHYQLAYVDPRYRVQYPPGLARRNYNFRIIAPNEGL